ncbi:alpha/beta fold hydrolase [Winogradskyella aquimaris]|uniref:Alpha/beta hydrolase n=1 Tax=Winogradskyella aquimaris TaxID=864074 RepID=A0ABU5EKK7_9FLAO|nr:alpha/beta hydrolase [Winogradskyella aquimaris]MDY2586930.1 alpha/beta hydrolase [Winogradskyella aquimaris]
MKKYRHNIIPNITLLLCFLISLSYGQEKTIAELEDVKIEYYDSGGDKTPLVFLHGDSRDGSQYDNFISNFEDSNRIITYSRRGYGKSSSDSKSNQVETDVDDLLNLLTFLEIDKAVFIGNSYAGFMMTYLAENHPEKNIGQIYLAGNPGFSFKEIIEKDPLNSYKMMFWAQGGEEYADESIESITSYQPQYITKETEIPNVPALGFLNADNQRGIENMNIILLYASAPERIEYDEPKKFFQKVSSEEKIKSEVKDYFENTVKPLLTADVENWVDSFPSLKIVNLDVRAVTGYEFERNPELVTSHIKEFLVSLKE